MQQLNWYWQALWALTSGWGALPRSLFPSFSCWFSKEIANLGCRQGRAALLEVSVRTPNSPGFYSVPASLPLNPCPREPFRWIDFLLECNIHYGSQYIMLSLCWKCSYSVTFQECLLLMGAWSRRRIWEDVLWGPRENTDQFHHRDTRLWSHTLHVYFIRLD